MTDYLKLMDEALAKEAGASAKKPPATCEKTFEREVISQRGANYFATQIIDNTQISQTSLISHPGSPCSQQNYSISSDTLEKTCNHINDAPPQFRFVDNQRRPEKSPDSEISEICEITTFASRFQALCFARPKGVDNQRFLQAIADGEQFLAIWGAQAAALGWRADDLFGLDPVAPLRRYDRIGLCWLLCGRPVVALTRNAATVRTASGNLLRFYRAL